MAKRRSRKKKSAVERFGDKLDFFSTPQKRKKASKGLRGYLKGTRRKMERGF